MGAKFFALFCISSNVWIERGGRLKPPSSGVAICTFSRSSRSRSRSSMVKRREGKIINIASMYSFFGSGFVPSYSAAKGALVQLTKSMAIELAPFNIQVNAIAPGWIETDLTAPVTTAASGSPPALLYQEIVTRTPAGRFGNPDECAGTAVFLASRASDFVTGATICVDGGYSIR